MAPCDERRTKAQQFLGDTISNSSNLKIASMICGVSTLQRVYLARIQVNYRVYGTLPRLAQFTPTSQYQHSEELPGKATLKRKVCYITIPLQQTKPTRGGRVVPPPLQRSTKYLPILAICEKSQRTLHTKNSQASTNGKKGGSNTRALGQKGTRKSDTGSSHHNELPLPHMQRGGTTRANCYERTRREEDSPTTSPCKKQHPSLEKRKVERKTSRITVHGPVSGAQ